MNTKFLNAIVLLGLFLSVSATANQATISALEQIKANEFANDFIGQQIVDTVLLQQQTGGPADVIIRLLNGLILNLNQQQQRHNRQHNVNNLRWAAQLAKYNRVVASLTAKILSLTKNIQKTRKLIRVTKYNIRLLVSQIHLITNKQSALKAARKIDKQAYLKRTQKQSEMLKAVNYIISQLQLALKAKSFVQLNDIKEQLAKLAKENPLQALVELTMTFNPASVNFCIQKLNEIKVALENSLKDESSLENQARKQYRALRAEMTGFLVGAEKQLRHQQGLLASYKIQLKSLKKERREARGLRRQYRALIANLVKVRNQYNELYRAQTIKRGQEVSIILKVVTIIGGARAAANSAAAYSFTPQSDAVVVGLPAPRRFRTGGYVVRRQGGSTRRYFRRPARNPTVRRSVRRYYGARAQPSRRYYGVRRGPVRRYGGVRRSVVRRYGVKRAVSYARAVRRLGVRAVARAGRRTGARVGARVGAKVYARAVAKAANKPGNRLGLRVVTRATRKAAARKAARIAKRAAARAARKVGASKAQKRAAKRAAARAARKAVKRAIKRAVTQKVVVKPIPAVRKAVRAARKAGVKLPAVKVATKAVRAARKAGVKLAVKAKGKGKGRKAVARVTVRAVKKAGAKKAVKKVQITAQAKKTRKVLAVRRAKIRAAKVARKLAKAAKKAAKKATYKSVKKSVKVVKVVRAARVGKATKVGRVRRYRRFSKRANKKRALKRRR